MQRAALAVALLVLVGCSEATSPIGSPATPSAAEPAMASVAAADATYGIFLSSPALAEAVPAGAAQFGLQIVNDGAFTLTANIAVARDATDEAGRSELDGCSPLTNTPDLAGRIALIQRGTCNFSVKASNAQNAGAIAVIIDDNVASQPVAGMGGVDPTVTIPAVRITLSNGQILRAALGAGTVIGTISTRPVVPPSITLPADIVVETSDPAGIAVSFDVTGHTELGASTPSCRVSVTFVTSPSVFPPGATTVICSVGDPWGHSAGGSFTVTVLPSEAPVFVARPPVVAEATGPSGAIVVFELPAATDNVGVTSVECDRASGSLFPLGASTVTCTASDAAGNVGQGTFEVRVLDTTAPTITFAGNGTYTVDQTVSITCTATDLVTASPSVTCPGGSGPAYGFDVGANTVTATARDEAGNTSTLSTSFVVNVTVGGICNLVKSWSPFATTTSSLCQALDAIAGELSPAKRAFLVRAFIFFVERQSGKTIPADRAAILIRLARAL